MTRVILADEKMCVRVFDASTDKQWARSALALLTERYNEGQYEEPEKPEPDDDSIWMRQYRADKIWYDQMKTVVENKVTADRWYETGEYLPLAWWLLLQRSDHSIYEYEEVQLIETETP